jgi:hypothetical protein
VFDTEGSFISREEGDPTKGFRDQVIYLNDRFERILEKIIAGSETPPIILFMGDHGPGNEEKPGFSYTEILNAYYLPMDGERNLYPSVTPVNSFRIIFSHYFGEDYPLIEDISYSSNFDETPFDFVEEDNSRSDCLIRYP